MLLKATPIIAIALELIGNTSIANTDLQIVIVAQLQEVINILIANGTLLKNRFNKIGIIKVKILLVKRFRGEKSKLKGFFT